MKNYVLVILFLLISIQISAQDQRQKLRGPVWIAHSANTDVVGISLAAYPTDFFRETDLSRTYGMRVEVFLFSPFYFLAPRSPISNSNEVYDDKMLGKTPLQVYGVNLSTGTFQEIDAYGFSVTGFIHYSRINYGIAFAGLTNQIENGNGLIAAFGGNVVYEGNGLMVSTVWGNSTMRFNGLQISGFNSIIESGSGVQIGLMNTAKNFRGIQIGLWNTNDKRSFPIINWQFKKV